MSSFERLKNISAEIAITSGMLQKLEIDKIATKMADRSYKFEMSILNDEEDHLSKKLSDLFEELKLVYKTIKGK